jgi:Fis family transcriptional regulator, factor for inversion stimulation protein
MSAGATASSPLVTWCEGLPRPLDLQPIYRLLGQPLFNVERALILATLEQCDWNRTHAAKQLGMSVRTMRNKIAGCIIEGLSIPAGEGTWRARERPLLRRTPIREPQWRRPPGTG